MTLATVSIVSHNHAKILRGVLGDLSRQDIASGIKVILTLNTTFESFDAADYPNLNIKVLRNEAPKGFGGNHNQAFGECRNDVFIVVNPDVRLPDPTALRRLLEALETEAGIIVPRIVRSEGAWEDSVRSNLSPWAVAVRVLANKREPVAATSTRLGSPFFWAAGMFLVLKADVFRELGGFDERFFMYCEDYDLSARAYLSGQTLRVLPDVEVVHDAQRDSHRSFKYMGWHLKSLLKVWTSRVFWRIVWSQRGLPSAER